MIQPAKRHATYQDVLEAPPHMVAELLRGELFLQPRPAIPHAEAASVLGMLLGPPFRLGRGGPGGWWLQYEPELHLGEDVLVPDLAGWQRDLNPDLDLSKAFYSVAPQWVCEVLSPSTQGKDRLRKLPIYAAHQVAHAWLVDPASEGLEVFRLSGGYWSLVSTHEGGEKVRAEPFDAVAIDLSELWIPQQTSDPGG